MRRKLSFTILLVFTMFFLTIPNIGAYKSFDEFPNWEFYPQGINYLNNNNFSMYSDGKMVQYNSVSFIKVKPNTDYNVTMYKGEIFRFINIRIILYNEQKEKVTEYVDNGLEDIHYSFTTSSETMYLKMWCLVERLDNNLDIYDIDEILVLYEGKQLSSPFDEQALSYKGVALDGVIYDDNEFIYLINEFDQKILLSDILASVKAFDDCDGDITNKIMIEYDSYSDNNDNLGTFEIILTVRDHNNNSSRLTFVIMNVDTTPPVITGVNFYETTPTDGLDLEYIKSKLSANDNYDGDISEKIELIEDNYTANKHQLGTYRLTYQVKDYSLNCTSFTVNVKVVDNEKPIILGPRNISKELSRELTLEEIISNFVALDNYDGDITHKIEVYNDEYSINSHRYGTYEISMKVSDSSGNTQYFDSYVTITDDIAPVFIVDQIMINLSLKNNPLNINEIINLLSRTKQINDPQQVIVLEDGYSKNNQKIGSYKVILQEQDEILEVVINLSDEHMEGNEENEAKNLKTTKESFWKKILNPIIKLWQNIKRFFIRT